MTKKRDEETSSSQSANWNHNFNDAMGDVSSMINSGFGVLSGASREMKEVVRAWVESSLQRMSIPSREELDTLVERVNHLQKRVDTLEKTPNSESDK